MKNLIIIGIIFSLISCTSKGINEYDNPKKALLVIDMQIDLVDENGKYPIEKKQINDLITIVNSIIDNFNENDTIIIYIRNIVKKGDIKNLFLNNATKEGTSGLEIDPRINIVSRNIFDKYKGSALSNEELNAFLIRNQINELFLCGIMADGCVYDTAVDAFSRNYKVNYYSNAVGSTTAKGINKAIGKLNKKGINTIEF